MISWLNKHFTVKQAFFEYDHMTICTRMDLRMAQNQRAMPSLASQNKYLLQKSSSSFLEL